jgi:cation diffusion facilitator family transporter
MTYDRAVRRVLLITLALNLLVASGKIVVGLLTGALAVLADGFHSLSDAAGNIAALVANAIAARPPDEDHPYGHRRFETVGALAVGVLLALTAWEVAQGAVTRLLGNGDIARTGPLTVIVLALTLVINAAVSTYQRRAGERLGSELLLADATNTRADIYVTASVLASTALVWAGFSWADTLVALVVAGLVLRAGLRVMWGAGGVLVDTAPYSPVALRGTVASVQHVVEVSRVRTRGTSTAAHIDIDVTVPPHMTCAQTASVASDIRACVTRHVRGSGGGVSEIEVHFAPAVGTPLAHHPRDHTHDSVQFSG